MFRALLTSQALSKKNGEFLGERFIKLLHVPPAEMEEQVTGQGLMSLSCMAPRMHNYLRYA